MKNIAYLKKIFIDTDDYARVAMPAASSTSGGGATGGGATNESNESSAGDLESVIESEHADCLSVGSAEIV